MTEPDDLELERLVRASLDTHAQEMDTTVPIRVGASHRRRWLALGAAAAAVAAVAVTGVVVGRAEAPTTEPPVAIPSPSAPAAPDGWRTEYWRGISVDVPVDWTWGVTPTEVAGHLLRCGEGGGSYVGRPIPQSDVCAPPTGAGPYVWLDSPLDPGTVELGGGRVQDTVDVNGGGTTVTVASDNEALRERVLSSIRTQDLCPPELTLGEAAPYAADVEGRVLESFDLCAYTGSTQRGFDLVYGRELGASDYERWGRASADGEAATPDCQAVSDVVVLRARFAGATRTWQVLLPCGPVRAGGDEISMTSDMDRIWLDEGLNHILLSYIGPLG